MTEKQLEKPNLNIASYIKVIWKRRILVLITMFFAACAAFGVSFFVRPMFKSTTTIVLMTEQSGILSSQALSSLMALANIAQPTTTDTELEIIRSNAVTEQVIKKLNLQVDRYEIPRDGNGRQMISGIEVLETARPGRYIIDFTDDEGTFKLTNETGGYIGTGRAGEDFSGGGMRFMIFPSNWEKSKRIEFSVYSKETIAKQMREDIITIEERANYMLDISAFATDGTTAKRIAEELINAYVDVTNSFKKSIAHETRLLIEDRMFETKRKRDLAEKKLVDYQTKNNTIFLGQNAAGLIDQIGTIQTAKVQAEIQSEALRRSLATLANNPADSTAYFPGNATSVVGGSTGDPVISELETQINMLRVRLSSYEARYTEKHPLVIETRDALSKAETELYSRLRARLGGYLTSYEAQLDAVVKEFNGMVATMPPEQMEMAHLAREVEELSTIYAALQGQYEQILIQETQEQSQSRRLRVVGLPTSPDLPEYPKKKNNALYGALAGLVLGIIFAFIVEYSPLVNTVASTRFGRWWQNRFRPRRSR